MKNVMEVQIPFGEINRILRRFNTSINSKDALLTFLEQKGNAVYNELLFSLIYGDVWDKDNCVKYASPFALRWNSLLPLQFYRYVAVFLPTDGENRELIVAHRPKSIFLDPIVCKEEALLNGLNGMGGCYFDAFDGQQGLKRVMVESFCHCIVFASAYSSQMTETLMPIACSCLIEDPLTPKPNINNNKRQRSEGEGEERKERKEEKEEEEQDGKLVIDDLQEKKVEEKKGKENEEKKEEEEEEEEEEDEEDEEEEENTSSMVQE